MAQMKTVCLLLLLAAGYPATTWAQPKKKEILHDAEYYVLEAQHGKK